MHPFLQNGQNGHLAKQIVITSHGLRVMNSNVDHIVTRLPIDLCTNFLINAPFPSKWSKWSFSITNCHNISWIVCNEF